MNEPIVLVASGRRARNRRPRDRVIQGLVAILSPFSLPPMSARRSARITARKETKTVLPPVDLSHDTAPSEASDYDIGSDHDEEVRRPRKKQKKAAPATKVKGAGGAKKKGGRLRMLAEMPVDVLLEVRLAI